MARRVSQDLTVDLNAKNNLSAPMRAAALAVNVFGESADKLAGKLDTASVKTEALAGKIDSKRKSILGTIGPYQLMIGAAVGAASAVGALVKVALDASSELVDMSEQLGISTVTLQEWQYAAGQSGVDADKMAQMMTILARKITEASEGNKETAETFARLGISVRDASGRVKSIEEIFPRVADGLLAMTDQSMRLDTVTRLLGKSAGDVTIMLQRGSAGLEDYARQAREAGAIVREDLLRANEELGDSVESMWGSIVSAWQSGAGHAVKFIKELRRQGEEDFLQSSGWDKARADALRERIRADEELTIKTLAESNKRQHAAEVEIGRMAEAAHGLAALKTLKDAQAKADANAIRLAKERAAEEKRSHDALLDDFAELTVRMDGRSKKENERAAAAIALDDFIKQHKAETAKFYRDEETRILAEGQAAAQANAIETATEIGNTLAGIFDELLSGAGSFEERFKRVTQSVLRMIGQMIIKLLVFKGIQLLLSSLGGPGLGAAFGTATGMADGGVVTGGVAGRDSVPAMLMPGEMVLPVGLSKQILAVAGGSSDSGARPLPFAAGGIVPRMGGGGGNAVIVNVSLQTLDGALPSDLALTRFARKVGGKIRDLSSRGLIDSPAGVF